MASEKVPPDKRIFSRQISVQSIQSVNDSLNSPFGLGPSSVGATCVWTVEQGAPSKAGVPHLSTLSGWVKAAVPLLLVTFIVHIVSFASPYWMQTDLAYSGLWRVCIVIEEDFHVCDEFIHQDLYDWMHLVQSGMCLSMFCLIGVLAALGVYGVMPMQMSHKACLSVSTFCTTFVSGLLTLAAAVIYGVGQGHVSHTLTWGYYLSSVSSLGQLLSAVLLLLEARRLRSASSDQHPILKPRDSLDSTEAGLDNAGLQDSRIRMNSYSSMLPSTPIPTTNKDSPFSYDVPTSPPAESRERTSTISAMLPPSQ